MHCILSRNNNAYGAEEFSTWEKEHSVRLTIRILVQLQIRQNRRVRMSRKPRSVDGFFVSCPRFVAVWYSKEMIDSEQTVIQSVLLPFWNTTVVHHLWWNCSAKSEVTYMRICRSPSPSPSSSSNPRWEVFAKLIVDQLTGKLPVFFFCVTRRIITVFRKDLSSSSSLSSSS
jgi:hypothetical protein